MRRHLYIRFGLVFLVAAEDVVIDIRHVALFGGVVVDLLAQLLWHVVRVRAERIVIHTIRAPARRSAGADTLRLALVLVQVGRFFVVADDVVAL